MSFEPQKFFIGLIDFFSVLLPGAILTYMAQDWLIRTVLGGNAPGAGTESIVIFLVSSYLLGHFIFLLGAWLDEGYDAFRGHSGRWRIHDLAWRRRLQPRWVRTLHWLVFKRERDVAVDLTGRIKALYLGPLRASSAVNNFQWARAYLSAESPDALASVHRFEADSKFFRSLVVVLVLVPFIGGRGEVRELFVLSFLLTPLALWRYMEQRHKATNQAYWAVIALEGRSGKHFLPADEFRSDQPTHAGGVVYRWRQHRIEYLMVEASRKPGDWVLPKGHIESGEHSRETAVREVREECGVWAQVEEDLGRMDYLVNGQGVRVQVYLMEARESGWPGERGRKHEWVARWDAKGRAQPQTREMLDRADRRIRCLQAGKAP